MKTARPGMKRRERAELEGGTATVVPGTVLDRSPAERRRSFRVPLAVSVGLTAADGASVLGLTLDCSTGGCAVQASRPLEPEEPVELFMELDDGPFVATGRVCYGIPLRAGYRLGLQFGPLTSANERRIAKLVAAQDRRLSVRVAVATSLEYRRDLPGEVFHLTASTDLSLGGMRFPLVSSCEIGDRLEMLIMSGAERIAVWGTVVWTGSDGSRRFAGVCFDPPRTFRDDDLMAAIRRLMDEFPHVHPVVEHR